MLATLARLVAGPRRANNRVFIMHGSRADSYDARATFICSCVAASSRRYPCRSHPRSRDKETKAEDALTANRGANGCSEIQPRTCTRPRALVPYCFTTAFERHITLIAASIAPTESCSDVPRLRRKLAVAGCSLALLDNRETVPRGDRA